MMGTEWPKFDIYKENIFLGTLTSNSLTGIEEHDIPSQILKTIFGLHASIIFIPIQYVWFPVHLWGPLIPNSSGQLAELIVYIIPPE